MTTRLERKRRNDLIISAHIRGIPTLEIAQRHRLTKTRVEQILRAALRIVKDEFLSRRKQHELARSLVETVAKIENIKKYFEDRSNVPN